MDSDDSAETKQRLSGALDAEGIKQAEQLADAPTLEGSELAQRQYI